MEGAIKARFEEGLSAPLSWSPTEGGKRTFVCFEDRLVEDLGQDPTGSRFEAITQRMIHGEYYPPDAVQFFGRFKDESRSIQIGDRIQQRAPFFPLKNGIYFWSMVEMFAAELREDYCQIGYVTTQKHHGRGIWTATLIREDGKLSLTVESTACPHSFLFWVGLPVARWMQLRARCRAIEEFRKL